MNPFLLIYIISAVFVFLVCCYEAYSDYKLGIHLKLTSGILAPLLLIIFPVLNTIVAAWIILCILCDNPTILKGKQ